MRAYIVAIASRLLIKSAATCLSRLRAPGSPDVLLIQVALERRGERNVRFHLIIKQPYCTRISLASKGWEFRAASEARGGGNARGRATRSGLDMSC